MTSHTPGPWQFYWRVTDGVVDCGVFWQKTPGHAYSVCRAPRYQSQAAWEADARLIAAAPELLEAVVTAAEILEDGHWSNKKAEFRALIAKATGATP